jgi:hypothetical protein
MRKLPGIRRISDPRDGAIIFLLFHRAAPVYVAFDVLIADG